MRWYVLRKVGQALLTLFIASVVVFFGVRALPGDAATAMSSEGASPEVLAQIRQQYGLDEPLPVQYADWIGHVLTGNLGTSPQTGLAVSAVLADRIPVTLELTAVAVLIALVISIPIGILAALKRNTALDYLSTTGSMLGLSVPHFWFGILFILLFAVRLHWLPASGFVPFATDSVSNLQHIIMPAVVLAIGLAAVLIRQMRSAMLQSLGEDYIRTARAKGLAQSAVIGKHALRNSLTAVVTVVGLQVGALISGVVVTEQIFVVPGIGKLTLDSVFNRDYPTLQAVVLVTASVYIVVNLLTDLVYSALNPRVRIQGAVT
ncbi:MAG: peptide/nickel transport system permease protein [Pseudonocardiales bacterium]|nr:peptide transporter [Pseudonocardia sp.]MDT7648845.1 peptide/nickel transport system permease protein [Pseudonocardiales bacterium]